MSDRFQDKYRIPSARLQNWDYSWNAAYFVTICTQKQLLYFGEILDLKMHLSEIGQIAEKYWKEIPLHFPFVELGDFIAMPNHVHGIIFINKPDNNETHPVETPDTGVFDRMGTPIMFETPRSGVSTGATPRTAAASKKWNRGTLGVIINQYKRICTIKAQKIYAGFAWQPRFYDHIIRDDQSFQRISEYIQNNPLNWHTDKFNVETPDSGVSTKI